ncbi:MAG: hypothetical protein KatS3mg089_0987 [Patescibacteria group bacterium]|nr:MAG: hypothetical protein KatS3mg089_0987 [Patescibacteria group bacterium]
MQRFIAFLLILTVFLLLFVGYYHKIGALTQDLGRHLLTGDLILKTGVIPKTNLYSYTFPNFPFINHHYGAEVIYALVFPYIGYQGLLLLTVFFIFLAFGLVFWRASHSSHILPLSLVSILYLRVLFERTDIRPEIFSFFFLSLFVTILFQYREQYTRLILLLIPLEVLWVNTHIYFPIGILLITLFLIEEIYLKRKNLLNQHTLVLTVVLIGAVMLLVLNPNGIKQALYPLNVFKNYGYTIEENQNPFLLQSLGFSKPSFFYLKISIFLLYLSLFLTIKKTRLIDWLLSISFTIIALLAVRNFPLFVFATLIPAARALSLSIDTILYKQMQKKIIYYLASIVVIILGLYQINSTAKILHFGYSMDLGAEQAANFLIKEKLKGPIFNNFDIGSYLEFRIYPKEKVFVDGRPEAYPASFFKDVYIPMQEDPQVFAEQDKKYNFNTIFFAHTDQTPWAETFLKAILSNPTWKVVYLDPYVIILVKDKPSNKKIISRFEISKDKLPMNNINQNDLISLYRAVSFYQKIGSSSAAIPLLQAILEKNPYDCPALSYLSSTLSAINHPGAVLYIQRHQTFCR